LEHQHVGLAEIQRVVGQGAVFDTLVVYQNYPRNPNGPLELTGLTIEGEASEDAAHYPLALAVSTTDEMELRFDYHKDKFDESTVRALGERLVRLLEQIVEDPTRSVSELDVLDPVERANVLVGWNDTGCVVSAGSVVELFAGQVGRSPGAVAVVGGGVSWSYGELARLSDRVAGWLVGCGVGVGGRVGVVVGRSPWLVAVLLGVWKAGAAFVPLDVSHPVERLRSLADEAGLDVVVADRVVEGLETVSLTELFAADPLTTPTVVSGESLAYVMFTSGSTGEPKGVAVTHRSVAAFVSDRAWREDVVARVLVQANHAFDASTYELWVPLARGGTLVVASAGEVDAGERGRLVAAHGVTNVHV
ncbi:AMP-binding protein, partial [Streptomyces sp. NPDC049906]|uniref:AMP-binding protein n=1 Tax=Streptomyces sp. NPDC049906 TaxID=3155656 RepID=UPI00341E1275